MLPPPPCTSGLGRNSMKGLQTETKLSKISSDQLKTALGNQGTAQNDTQWLKTAQLSHIASSKKYDTIL